MPVPQHPFPARVAGWHASGCRAFLDCYACGWMRGGVGKGESTGQGGIKRQAEKEKGKQK